MTGELAAGEGICPGGGGKLNAEISRERMDWTEAEVGKVRVVLEEKA